MKTDTSAKIIAFIKDKGQASPKDLYDLLHLSSRGIFKQLNTLTEKNILSKTGRPPKVFYKINEKKPSSHSHLNNTALTNLINERFYYISPLGEELTGLEGFQAWCIKQNVPLEKTASEYTKTLEKYDHFKKNNLIDGTSKITATFKKIYLDKLFYLDFYAIERFGKTKLGQLLLSAKSSQNRKQITALIDTISAPVNKIIQQFDIDAVGFIPPTVKREIQLMNELKKHLHVKKHLLSIVKAKTNIIVAQKTLNKLDDRVLNAQKTLFVEDNQPFKNILLIDDAVGSGATINETAAQIRHKKICTGKIIGLAIVGSFKGFDVISEV
ncbi:MAG: hypothetical protein HQL25_04215 [Candidatus Omnitrophica bacterium]|nr:hypothetical protein [Candidatus Omnitrophota bacterium]